MPGESKFYEIVGRALADADFRDALMHEEQVEAALSPYGIEPTQEVKEALANAVAALDRLSGVFSTPPVAS
jgi:hypothetical protein